MSMERHEKASILILVLCVEGIFSYPTFEDELGSWDGSTSVFPATTDSVVLATTTSLIGTNESKATTLQVAQTKTTAMSAINATGTVLTIPAATAPTQVVNNVTITTSALRTNTKLPLELTSQVSEIMTNTPAATGTNTATNITAETATKAATVTTSTTSASVTNATIAVEITSQVSEIMTNTPTATGTNTATNITGETATQAATVTTSTTSASVTNATIAVEVTSQEPQVTTPKKPRVPDTTFHTATTGMTVLTPPIYQWRQTVVLIRVDTFSGQNVFIRGGISHDKRDGCENRAGGDCSIPLKHRIFKPDIQTEAAEWSRGDDYLDWYGSEKMQGTANNVEAQGTPLVWTTSISSYPHQVDKHGYGHTPINKHGSHYWMLNVDMDCSRTGNGWFEFKVLITNYRDLWEPNIQQSSKCGGTAGGEKPYSSNNHMARCGKINVFAYGENHCTINDFISSPIVG